MILFHIVIIVFVESEHTLFDLIHDRIDPSCKTNLCLPSVDTCVLYNDMLSCDKESRASGLLKKKDNMLKIHLLSYFLMSIYKIRLDEDCAYYLIVDIELILLKKKNHLGKDNIHVLDYLINPTSYCSYDVDDDCDPLLP